MGRVTQALTELREAAKQADRRRAEAEEALTTGESSAAEEAARHAHEARRREARLRNDLYMMIFDEVCAVARRILGKHGADLSIGPRTLVGEAFKQLSASWVEEAADSREYLSRAGFVLKRTLFDHVRSLRARPKPLPLDDDLPLTQVARRLQNNLPAGDLLDLEAALNELNQESSRQSQIVELRVFFGFNHSEIADLLKVGRRTVERDWSAALDRLRARLEVKES